MSELAAGEVSELAAGMLAEEPELVSVLDPLVLLPEPAAPMLLVPPLAAPLEAVSLLAGGVDCALLGELGVALESAGAALLLGMLPDVPGVVLGDVLGVALLAPLSVVPEDAAPPEELPEVCAMAMPPIATAAAAARVVRVFLVVIMPCSLMETPKGNG